MCFFVISYYSVGSLLDSSGKFLLEVLEDKEKPLLIKPNLEELVELVGQRIYSSIQLEKFSPY